MTKAKERALEVYPINIKECLHNDGLYYEDDIYEDFRIGFIQGYEQAQKDLTFIAQVSSGPDGFFYGKGYQQAKKDLGWHPSTEHPPVDEEVIVLLGSYDDLLEIAFGHIVDKEIAVDYDGWNIPGVRYWMPMPEIPKEGRK